MGDENKDAPEATVALADAIEDLRSELQNALARGKDAALHFRLKPIELEMSVGITKKGDGKAGVKFWVVELGAGGSYENATTHRLKLLLEPVTGPEHGEALIGDHVRANPLLDR